MDRKPKTGPPPPAKGTNELYDRRQRSLERIKREDARIERLKKDDPNYWVKVITSGSVSYTHLTLPTICSV